MSTAPPQRPSANADHLLLRGDDPKPVEWVNAKSQSPILLVCEHAGQAIPAALNGLGLPAGAIDQHIGFDIGADALARRVASTLGAPLILQRYSRLVIDCNRPPGSLSSIPHISDGVIISGNQHITDVDRRKREHEIFAPLDAAFDTGFAQYPRRAVFSIHSFTRRLREAPPRAWDAGFLSRTDLTTAQTLLETVASEAPELALAINEPYRIEDNGDWFIPHHAERRGVRHCLIEVCNDHLCAPKSLDRWSALLARAINAVLAR